MVDNVQKLTKLVNMVVDACHETLSDAKDCTLLPNPRRFIQCKEDPSWMTDAILQLILLYDPQVLSTKSEINA